MTMKPPFGLIGHKVTRNNQADVERRMALLLRKALSRPLRAKTLREIAQSMGVIEEGEFRSGNGNSPGSGFSGVRMGYPGFSYDGLTWNMVGVNNDVIQFGLRSSDGVALAGAGAVILDDDGVSIETNIEPADNDNNRIKFVNPNDNTVTHSYIRSTIEEVIGPPDYRLARIFFGVGNSGGSIATSDPGYYTFHITKGTAVARGATHNLTYDGWTSSGSANMVYTLNSGDQADAAAAFKANGTAAAYVELNAGTSPGYMEVNSASDDVYLKLTATSGDGWVEITDFDGTPSTPSGNQHTVYVDRADDRLKSVDVNGRVHIYQPHYALVEHTQGNGVAGGTATSGSWRTYPFNSEERDTDNMVSNSNGTLTLEAGRYEVQWAITMCGVDGFKTRLRTAGGTNLNFGLSGHSPTSGTVNTVSHGADEFTIDAQTVMELQYRCQQTRNADGLGHPAGVGQSEHFGWIKFKRFEVR